MELALTLGILVFARGPQRFRAFVTRVTECRFLHLVNSGTGSLQVPAVQAILLDRDKDQPLSIRNPTAPSISQLHTRRLQ